MTATADTRAVPVVPARRRPATGKAARVRLTDRLVDDGLADARWLLLDALRGGARTVVVDLSGLHTLNGALVASLLSAHRTCRARGGAVVLRGADSDALQVLHRTGMWRVLQVEPATGTGGR